MNDFLLEPKVSGHRDANAPYALPDVRLTADEFIHWQAVTQEATPGGERAHYGPVSGYPRGFFKPGCAACESIMAKSGAVLDEAERAGFPTR